MLRQERIHLKLKGRTLGFEYLCPSPARVSPKKTKLTLKKSLEKGIFIGKKSNFGLNSTFSIENRSENLKWSLTRRNSDRRYTNNASKPLK